jgi:hypothetical protein
LQQPQAAPMQIQATPVPFIALPPANPAAVEPQSLIKEEKKP